MQFTRKVRVEGNVFIISIPKDLVDAYGINNKDLITFDIVKVHRDKIKSG